MKKLLGTLIFMMLFGVAFSQNSFFSCNNWLATPSQPSYVNAGQINVTGDKITVEATFNRTLPYSGGMLYAGDLVSKHNTPADANYLLRPSDAEITTSNGYFRTPDICDIQLNKTYHVAMVYDGSTLKFYRNGRLMSQVAATGNLFQNNWQTRIGWYEPQGATTNFLGYINEVRIWNVVRTQAQLNTYLNAPLPNPATQTGLLAYYQFDNLLNKQGNAAYNGTLGGSASLNQTNTNCTFTADSCSILNQPQFCTGSLGSPVANITFGSGAANPGPELSVAIPGASTNYNFAAYATGTPPTAPNDGDYALVNTVPLNSAWFTGAKDHTGNPNGYMAFFNSAPSPGEFYRQTVSNLCPGTTYEFAAWVANVINPAVLPGTILPNITFKILDPATQAVLGTYNTGDIPTSSTMTWGQYSFVFILPATNNAVTLVLANNNIGGTAQPGNDLAIDDITFRPCGPLTKASFSSSTQVDSTGIASCGTVNIFGKITGSFNNPTYQWQMSSDGGVTFININGATGLTALVSNLLNGQYQFRMLSAETGNINSENCRFISNVIKLTVAGCNTPVSVSCNNWLHIPNYNTTDYAAIGDLDIIGNKITVEASFEADTNYFIPSTISYDLVSKHTGPSDCNYLLRPVTAEITTTNGFFQIVTCDYKPRKINHAALVYDGTTLKFYRNGYLMGSKPATGNLLNNDLITKIGNYSAGTLNGSLKGYMNEVRIWNVARTENEIKTYMNASLPNPTTQPGLVSYYTFDNLTNKQGNALYNATLNGAASINTTVPNCAFIADSCPVIIPVNSKSVIINTYTPVVAFNPCGNKITVEDASTFNIGDTVLMIQMKGAVIDSSNTSLFGSVFYGNAGNYDFNFVKSKAGNIIELKNVLLSQYDVPNGRVQLIRVPYFQTYRGTDTLTCLPWDGRKGGVLVLNARDSVVLNADINVKGKGFRGGNSPNPFTNALSCGTNGYFYPNTSTIAAAKGESIYDIGAAISYGRGNNASGGGGGNGHNSGGGGGGNGGTGGFGGKELEACNNTSLDNRGIGGTALPVNPGINKIFLGGGGGSGHTDNAGGIDMNGSNGGGIAFVITNQFKNNNYKIIADGDSVVNCDNALNNCHDASGGAGSGGTILMQVNNYVNAVNVQSKGGKGGDLVIFDIAAGAGRIGPGGGGGGGLIWVSQGTMPGTISPSLNGGPNGTIPLDGNNAWGSTPGQPGSSKFNLVIPFDISPFKPSIDSVRIKDSAISCSSFDFKGQSFLQPPNSIQNWQWTFGDNTGAVTQNTSHTYSTSGTYSVKLVVTDINGCKDSVTTSVTTFAGSGDFYYRQDACNPFSVQFFGVNSAAVVGGWQIDTAVINNTNNPVYTFAAAGNYTVKYIVKIGLCTDTITKIIPIGITPADIIITPDTTICFNSTKQLGTIASLNFCWSPVNFLNDPGLQNPVTNTPQTITYFFTAATEGNNLVTNPSFSNGNAGFTSQYNPSNTSTAPGQYFVGTNPQTWNASLGTCTDHTSASGNMLLVNTDAVPNVNVWTQTIPVSPNTNYSFGTWLQSLSVSNPAQVSLSINGNDADTVIVASTTACNWQRFYTTWNSGNKTTATIAIVNKNVLGQGSYFALDDISFAPVLIKRDSVIINIDSPVVKTIADTATCRGVQIQLTATGAATYQWQPSAGLSNPGSANPIASPSDSTWYYVTGTNINNCSATDSVLVAIKPSPVVLKTADTSVCKNTAVQLNVSGGDSYLWQADSTLSNDSIPNPIVKPVATTTYYVQTTSAGFLCAATDSIKVSIKTAAGFTISPPDSVCAKTKVQLIVTGGNVFSWQPANLLDNPTIANPIATPKVTTTFIVNVTDSVCGDTAILRTTLTTIPLPNIRATKSNDIDCFYLNAKLNVTGGNGPYSWTSVLDGPLYLSDSAIANPLAYPSATKTYFVTGIDTNTHCTNTDSVQVLVYQGNNPMFWVPNAFSPNNDTNNDCFRVYPRSRLKYFELYIYNRWGNKVFETTTITDCWDGTYKGQPQDPGNFVYYIKASNDCKDDFIKGNLLLIR